MADLSIGTNHPLTVLAGPCVLETPQTNLLIGERMKAICAELGLNFIFKASYDKANRSSISSARGPGLQAGLDELRRLRETLDVPVVTDIHQPDQAAAASDVADLLQIPAFLCRQTDLLVAAAETGRAVNVKKGQFMSPGEMKGVIGKLRDGGAAQIMLTERGTFFGYHRLVNDFIGIGDMLEMGPAICFDVTHSTQLPGAGKDVTAGRPERAALLSRAAVAAGVDALFIECHPDPEHALSDASTMQTLDAVEEMLQEAVAIRTALAEIASEAAAAMHKP